MKSKLSLRVLSFVLAFSMFSGLVPYDYAFAADRINIGNDYIEVTSTTDGSSFGINTLKGNPSKRFDDNKPLLYDGDDKFATSYTTVRIVKNPGMNNEETQDYVYGSSKGTMVRPPYEYQVDGENKAIVSVWSIDGVEITQQLTINGNTASAYGGYANISYSYRNTNAESVGVGIRILLDTKIADNDGGQFFKNGGTSSITKEVEFSGDSVPEWYSISDSITYSTTSAYGLLKNSEMTRYPDTVQMAHWYNLANTLWDYTVQPSVNFDDYYNEYQYADSAISIMFNPQLIAANESSSVDTMYGVGELNGMESTSDNCVMTVTQKEELKANSDNTGYANDGEITLYVTIDNSDKDSKQIVDGQLKLVFEDKVVDDELNMTQEPAIWVPTENEEDETISVGHIGRGEIKRNIPVKLKARPVYVSNSDPTDIVYTPTAGYTLKKSIDTRKITMQLTGDGTPIPSVASKVITMPSLGDSVNIGFTGVDPKTIYCEGYSYFSVQGTGSSFHVLSDKSQWTAYLRNVVTNKIINIDSFNCSVDVTNKQLGLLVDMGGVLGEYELTIKFKKELESLGEKVFSSSEDHIKTTNDEKYKNRGYSVAVIARTSDKNEYDMKLFSAGTGKDSVEDQFEEYKAEIEKKDGEILLEGRGVFKVLYKESATDESKADDNITVSTDSGKNNKDIIGFETIPGSDNVKLNRIMYYKSMTPLSFKADFDSSGKPTEMKVEGDGDLSVINASTIWKNKFQIRIITSDIYAYSDDDESGLWNTVSPQLQLLGGGWLLQNMGGFIFTLNYGELGCQDGRYTINFGGSISFPLGMNKDDDDKKDTGNNNSGSNSGGTGSGANKNNTTSKTSSSSTPANASNKKTGTDALKMFEDGGSFGVSIDSILFGEHEDRDDENNIVTGFVGIAATIEIELPKSVFPAGGQQNNDSKLTNGAAKSNPTSSQIVSASNKQATTAKGQNQNAANAQSKNQGKLNAFSAGVTFNTYEFNAGVDLGIGIGPLSSAFRMSLAETNNGKICLDTIYFEVKGFTVPIVPGVIGIRGLGGGISDLASSINYNGEARPPVTVQLMGVLDLVEVMVMQADLAVSGNGLSLAITGAPKGFENVKFIARGDMDWTTGFTLQFSGTVDLFSGIVLGNVSLGFTTSPEFFMMGKINGSLNIPGLGSLAGVTLAITSKYIAGGAKILIFSGGFVYYYDSNKFRLLQGSEIDELEAIDLDAEEMSSDKDTGKKNNTTFLEVHQITASDGSVQVMGIGAGAQVVSTTIDNRISSLYSATNQFAEGLQLTTDINEAMIRGNDVVLRVYYEGDTAPQFSVVKPNGEAYAVVPYDYNKTQDENNAAGANMLLSEKTDSTTNTVKKYAYITLNNADLATGTWTVNSTNNVNISDYTVLTMPTVNPNLSINSASISGTQLSLDYTADENAKISVSLVPCDDNGKPIIQSFTDDDGNLIENEHPGYIIADGKGSNSMNKEINIPSGKYIVRVDSILNESVYTYKYTNTPMDFVNPNTIAAPSDLAVSAGGDGRLDITASLPEHATGIQLEVYKRLENNGEEKLEAIGGYAGEPNSEGKIKTYFKGENSITNDEGGVVATSAIVPGETYFVKARAINVNEGCGYFASDVVKSADITIPIPDPPQVEVNVISYNAQSKIDEKNKAYLQASNSNVLIEYDIKNFATEPNDEVKVRFDVDGTQFGDIVTNNAESGSKGYASFDLSDGEHSVDIVFTNKVGDVTVETRNFSVDTIPADIKIEYPQNGSLFDPAKGIELKLTTDDSVTIVVYLDDTKVISGDYVSYKKTTTESGSNTYSTVYEKTIPVANPKYSHEVKIVATDKNGNSTEHIATVVNKKVSKIAGILIKNNQTSSDITELTAVGLDEAGEELDVAISQNKLKWTMLSDPSLASLVINSGNNGAVVIQNSKQPFQVMAQWPLGGNQYLSDVYDSGIVGGQNQSSEKGNGSSGGGGSTAVKLPEEVSKIVKEVKDSMSSSAQVNANKMYAGVDFVSKQDGNAVFEAGKNIAKENYIVIGTDKNTSAYANGLPENSKFRSDIMQTASLSEMNDIMLDFEVIGDGDNSNIGVYRYAESIGKWIYIGGKYDAARNMMSVTVSEPGRYAVIENPKMSELEFADIDGNWEELYIRSLAYAGLVDGYLEDGVTYYKPYNEITRGEFVKLLASATITDLSDNDVSMFADGEEIPDWVAPYVVAAYKAGWFKGIETERGLEANLSAKITRQDAMTLVYRVFFDGEKSNGKLDFADSSKVAEYAAEAVSYLTENGIVSGYDDGNLGPHDSLLREQIAKILWISILK